MSRLARRVLAAISLATLSLGAGISAGRFSGPVGFVQRAAAGEPARATLAEDGRIGKVTDLQGIVLVKPAARERWTPVDHPILILPGDRLRTDPRGANAVSVRLGPATGVTLGPGTLVECVQAGQIRLVEGEVKIDASAKAPVVLLGPGNEAIAVHSARFYRVHQEKLVNVSSEPPWLRYYEGRTSHESIGSLVAKVEGRNVPLSVGFHKVSVDIRDQIARTVIEESFVNHTQGTLEGVFYFPLPQDASISGFGMWIGDQLVEADIVEKQRAREIYETILRERRDPGLLEWSGGNLFKARVFPIFGNSEKRITISYTQVLPLRGNRYRYQYALQSDLLKQHPLRELAIDVKVSSVLPLVGVTSPTHPARIDRTAHSAHVEFSAQEYNPTRDFEVVVEVDPPQSGVVLIPHRRGDDGYFLVQLTPPGSAGSWQRELLPDGQPIELLILADTSASMDAGSRAVQTQLVAALLASLAPKDGFNLAVCDVDCRWAFDKPQAADAKHVAAAKDMLAGRASLGWTNLDKAFASAVGRSGPRSHVVYIGDGIPTTGDGDPAALARRLKRLYEGHRGTFHAVAVSASFERVVLNAIGSLGGGSVRQVSGERGPQAVAAELLAEILQPGLRDLKVEFRRLRTARVYPQKLPNLPAGSQQILLGRYLPEGPVGRVSNPSSESQQQPAEVIVTGTQDGKPVRFTAKAALREAEQGNSFIPRLWARMHLDALLAQGASQAVQDEIVVLSEQYHIITPYTSLLVLESDADRERFKVKRGFRIRDGERFFAEGRDNVNYDLVQKQMRRAAGWRVGLRREVLADLARLGRDPEAINSIRDLTLQEAAGALGTHDGTIASFGMGGMGMVGSMGPMAVGAVAPFRTDLSLVASQTLEVHEEIVARAVEGRFGRARGRFTADVDMPFAQTLPSPQFGGYVADADDLIVFGKGGRAALRSGGEGGLEEDSSEPGMEGAAERPLGDLDRPRAPFGALAAARMVDFDSRIDLLRSTIRPRSWSLAMQSLNGVRRGLGAGWDIDNDGDGVAGGGPLYAVAGEALGALMSGTRLDQLFPNLAPPAVEPTKRESTWPAEARSLARSLLRRETLARLAGGMEITTRTESFDPRWNELTGRSGQMALVSPSAWLVRTGSDDSETTVDWCDRHQRGVLSKAFELGRVRASTPRELAHPPLDLKGSVFIPLDVEYAYLAAELKPQGGDRTMLLLSPRAGDAQSPWAARILIDTARHVILRIETFSDGKREGETRFSDFVEVAGAWWAGRIEAVDREGRIESVTVQKFSPLAAGALDQRFQQELAGRDRVQFLREPLPRLAAAKRNLHAGKATFEDRVVLMARFMRSQQWARAMEHLRGAERLAAGKPGMRWVRAATLSAARLREEWKKGALEEAARIAGPQGAPEEYVLATHLMGEANEILEPNEKLVLLDLLRPVYQRQPPHVDAIKVWSGHRIGCLEQTGQTQEVLALQKQLAEQYPHDAGLQDQYARGLAISGDYEAAYAWLARALSPNARWNPHEEGQLRSVYAELLHEQGRYPDLANWLAAWLKRAPEKEEVSRWYLSALIRADRVDEANALIAQWLKDVQQSPQAAAQVRMRAQAAIAAALGQMALDLGDDPFAPTSDGIEPRWLEPLAEAALTLAQNEFTFGLAEQIMGDDRFRETDQARRVRKVVAQRLRAELEKLAPNQMAGYMRWIPADDPAIDAQAWSDLAARLRNRWRAEKDAETRDQLAEPLSKILERHLRPEDVLEFLRERLARPTKDARASCARELLDKLLEQPWRAEYETEALRLLERLSEAEEPNAGLASQVAALHEVTDRMVQARYEAGMKAVEHPEKLTRLDLAAKRRESLRAAREGYADRLRQEIPKHAPALAAWMNIERLYLDVRAGRNLDKAAEECWEYLGSEPRKAPDNQKPATLLEGVLRQRFLMTLVQLAARKEAKPQAVERVAKYLGRAIVVDSENDRWKALDVLFLVAIDRPKDLEATLRTWIEADDPDNRWRAALGYLVAEQGRLKEAIELFEAIRARDELGPDEYSTLANWYMAVGRRQGYERARIDAFKADDESQLGEWLSARLNPWQYADDTDPFAAGSQTAPLDVDRSLRDRKSTSRGDATTRLPSELDPEVPLAFTALLEKSSQPQQHLDQLRRFYRATHDFRLLAGLVDAVPGHTAGSVSPLLEALGLVLQDVRDEATVDSIVERIGEVRKRTSSVVDQRALDLLEVLAERRGAELPDQPGTHGDRALAALRRATKRQWTAGEPRLMADFLGGLGEVSYRALAEEQILALKALHRDAPAGSEDRLHIARRLAEAFRAYERFSETIDLLEAALRDHQAAQGGTLPMSANDALDQLISCLEHRGHYARGEKILQEQLSHPANQQQVYWLTERLTELYVKTACYRGTVSLGTGKDLYRVVNRRIQGELDTPDDKHRQTLIGLLFELYHGVREEQPGMVDDLRALAFTRVPEVLKRQRNGYEAIVGNVAQTLFILAGPRDALAFLIERIEQEPTWLRLSNRGGWSQHGHQLAQNFHDVKDLGGLEERLLAIVTAELRRDLESRQRRHSDLYCRDGFAYWAEKADVFARTAEQVLARHKDSGATVIYIANYFYDGLDRPGRAIEILLDAHRRGVLDEKGQHRLAEVLHRRERFADSIPILEPLVRRWPENVRYRTMLMHAFYRTRQPNRLLALLKETDASFHKDDRWQESVIAALASSCLENHLYEQSVVYYQEAIPLHQRTAPRRGIGDGTLASYHADQARAYAGLGKTPEAVDAACAAIVSWGPRHDQRTQALASLQQVLHQSRDLEAYVAWLDKEAARTGLGNPIVRKALGQAYAEKGQYSKAIFQFRLAAELQPNDAETYRKLVECCDKLGDKEGAVRELLRGAELSRRDVQLFAQLADRLKALGRPDEAERACTSMVEILPGESEGHALLAEIRQRENRWADAIAEWEQVARIRPLEPTGLLKLAEAQIHQRRWDDAWKTVQRLKARAWPPRFQGVDSQIGELERQVRERRDEHTKDEP